MFVLCTLKKILSDAAGGDIRIIKHRMGARKGGDAKGLKDSLKTVVV